MDKALICTEDMGAGWIAYVWSDGSAALSNPEKDQRIDLEPNDVDNLLSLVERARGEAA